MIEANHIPTTIQGKNIDVSAFWNEWRSAEEIPHSPDIQRLVKQKSDTLFLASACESLQVFKIIFNLCPEQLFFKDIYGNTILHNALANYGQSAIEIVEFLLDIAPVLAQTANNYGMLPLHQALVNRRQPQIIKALLQAFPQGISQENGALGTPAQLFFDEWLDQLEDNIDDFEELQLYENQEGNDFDIVVSTLVAIIETATRNVSSNLRADLQVLPVHDALKLDNIVIPPVFTQLLIKTFPDESMKCDENGNYPLHVGVKREGVNSEVIESLIEENPEALSYQNKEGRTPFELARENHQTQDVIQAILRSSGQATN